MLALDKYPQPVYLSLWIVVVAAGGDGNTNLEYYQGRTVAYTKKEAGDTILKQLEQEMPELYKRGIDIGGWRMTHADGISAIELERMFTKRANAERKVERIEVDNSTNALIRDIIKNRDIHMLHRAIREGRLNKYESMYIHDKLAQEDKKE